MEEVEVCHNEIEEVRVEEVFDLMSNPDQWLINNLRLVHRWYWPKLHHRNSHHNRRHQENH